MKKWLYQKIVIQLLEIHDTPARIARGVGIGTVIAFTPFIGFQMIITAIINTFLHANRLAGILMAWITNPVTIFIIYPINYLLGYWILSLFSRWEYVTWDGIIELFKLDSSLGMWTAFLAFLKKTGGLTGNILIPMLLGGSIIGAVCGLLLYRITYRAIVRSRKRKSKIYYKAIEGAVANPENSCICASISPVAKDYLQRHYTWDDIKYTVFIFRDRCIQCGRGYKRYLIDLFEYLNKNVAHLTPELKRRAQKDVTPEDSELATTLLSYIEEAKTRKKAGVWTESPEEALPAESDVPELPDAAAPRKEEPTADPAGKEKTDHGVEV